MDSNELFIIPLNNDHNFENQIRTGYYGPKAYAVLNLLADFDKSCGDLMIAKLFSFPGYSSSSEILNFMNSEGFRAGTLEELLLFNMLDLGSKNIFSVVALGSNYINRKSYCYVPIIYCHQKLKCLKLISSFGYWYSNVHFLGIKLNP